MLNKIVFRSIALPVLLVFISGAVRADSWLPPSKRKYYSDDKKYCLEVFPKRLESQLAYFEDKVAGRKDAGAAKGLKNNRSKAIFYVRGSIGYSKTVEFPLVNEVSPISALVSGDGRYVVTFDNWHSAGYGDDVVVIYRSDGTLVRKFGLEDLFTNADIGTFKHTTSSIWWGEDHFIDDKKEILHLKAGDKGRAREVTIDLKTGNPLEPKRDLFPELQIIPKVELELVDTADNQSPGAEFCTVPGTKFDLTDATRTPSQQLRSKFKRLTLPGYPPIALATRAEGKVVVEVVVSKTGKLICARTLSGHPLLRMAALQAVKLWEFEPLETAEGSKIVGTFAISFKLR
jgi:TonB family protein